MKNTQRGFVGIIVIIIIAALAIGGGTYYAHKKSVEKKQNSELNDPKWNSETQATSTVDVKAGLNGKGSLRSLLATGKSVMCTFTSDKSSGTVYVADGKMSGTFTAGTYTGNMVSDGKTYYVWSGTQGVKMSLDASTEAHANNSTQSQGNVDINQNVDYKCSEWKKDESKFVLPPTVKFIDLQAMLNTKVKVGQ
jgi:hypothetical protein